MNDEDDDDLVALVPAAFATIVHGPDRKDAGAYDFEALQGEAVHVRANGFSYRGVLVGADEGELYLRGELRWVILPLHSITSVALDKPPRALGLPSDVLALDEDER
ncbi:MAG TPA: hypothetical protein VGO62_21180 [Myxococcota bacterium]